jgi:hypothetical protein
MSTPTKVDIRDLVRMLNKLCTDDIEAMKHLADLRVACNVRLSSEPGVKVTRCQEDYNLTMIGVVDVFNAALSGSGFCVRPVYDKRGNLQGFSIAISG